MRVALRSQGTDVIYHRVRVTRVADQQDNAEATLPAQGRAEVHEPSASQRQKAESFVALNLRSRQLQEMAGRLAEAERDLSARLAAQNQMEEQQLRKQLGPWRATSPGEGRAGPNAGPVGPIAGPRRCCAAVAGAIQVRAVAGVPAPTTRPPARMETSTWNSIVNRAPTRARRGWSTSPRRSSSARRSSPREGRTGTGGSLVGRSARTASTWQPDRGSVASMTTGWR